MSENKKVIGTKKVFYEGYWFDSTLEKNLYVLLKEAGFDPEVKPEKVLLMEGFRFEKIQEYWCRYKKRGQPKPIFQKDERKVINMTYTYDFGLTIGKYRILFDAKGNKNDTYPLKKKLFFNKLESSGGDEVKYIFFEPGSIREIKQCIEIIKNLL